MLCCFKKAAERANNEEKFCFARRRRRKRKAAEKAWRGEGTYLMLYPCCPSNRVIVFYFAHRQYFSPYPGATTCRARHRVSCRVIISYSELKKEGKEKQSLLLSCAFLRRKSSRTLYREYHLIAPLVCAHFAYLLLMMLPYFLWLPVTAEKAPKTFILYRLSHRKVPDRLLSSS